MVAHDRPRAVGVAAGDAAALPKAVQVIPGGESGNPAGPWFGNQLGLWLTNDYHEATTRRGEIDVALRLRFVPAS